MTTTLFEVSGLDDLTYEVEVRDEDDALITAGTVKAILCIKDTATRLIPGAEAEQALTYNEESEKWEGTHDDAAVAVAIADVALKGKFDICVQVNGLATRRIKQCRKVAVVAA